MQLLFLFVCCLSFLERALVEELEGIIGPSAPHLGPRRVPLRAQANTLQFANLKNVLDPRIKPYKGPRTQTIGF